MIVVVQRVKHAQVTVDAHRVGAIGEGYMLLVGIQRGDTKEILEKMAAKIIKLRVMEDENHKMNKNILESQGAILAVSQFTLCADAQKGNRPSFLDAMEPPQAKEFFDHFVEELRKSVRVETGTFGSFMEVTLNNDGPTTIILDSKDIF